MKDHLEGQSSDEEIEHCKADLDDEKPAESKDAPAGEQLDEPKEPWVENISCSYPLSLATVLSWK